MATSLKLRPLASSASLSHLSGASPSYSEQIHPALNNKGIDLISTVLVHETVDGYILCCVCMTICSASDHMQSHRQRIVKEMFDTEHTYISQLNTIVSVSNQLAHIKYITLGFNTFIAISEAN